MTKKWVITHGGQTMGEKLCYVQTNKWGMHTGEKNKWHGDYDAESNTATTTLQNQMQVTLTEAENNIYSQKLWRSNIITQYSS